MHFSIRFDRVSMSPANAPIVAIATVEFSLPAGFFMIFAAPVSALILKDGYARLPRPHPLVGNIQRHGQPKSPQVFVGRALRPRSLPGARNWRKSMLQRRGSLSRPYFRDGSITPLHRWAWDFRYGRKAEVGAGGTDAACWLRADHSDRENNVRS